MQPAETKHLFPISGYQVQSITFQLPTLSSSIVTVLCRSGFVSCELPQANSPEESGKWDPVLSLIATS